MAKRLVPLMEWAARKGIPPATARKMAATGQIPAEKLSGRFWMVVEVDPEVPGETGYGTALTLFTHAGGAGKTSLARDLGFELASRGHRVLLVDLDPQANLSAWLGFRNPSPEETVLPLLEGEDLPKPKPVLPNLDLIPGHVEVARAEVLLLREPHNTFALRGALESLRQDYGFILIDSLPSLGSLAATAALAGDGLVVPVELSVKGAQALGTVLSVARSYAVALGRMRLWAGRQFVRLVVPTMAEGTVRDREALALLEERLRGEIPLGPPLVRRPALYREAQERGVPVGLLGDPAGREEVRQVAEALLAALAKERAVEGEVVA